MCVHETMPLKHRLGTLAGRLLWLSSYIPPPLPIKCMGWHLNLSLVVCRDSRWSGFPSRFPLPGVPVPGNPILLSVGGHVIWFLETTFWLNEVAIEGEPMWQRTAVVSRNCRWTWMLRVASSWQPARSWGSQSWWLREDNSNDEGLCASCIM